MKLIYYPIGILKKEDLDNIFLWKYVDIYKLLDIVFNSRIYFSRFDSFQDDLEGLTQDLIIGRNFLQTDNINAENINPTIEDPEQVIKNLRSAKEAANQKIKEQKKSLFASCWHISNKESIAMWKLYSKLNGVAIRVNAKKLVDDIENNLSSLPKDIEYFFIGKVSYEDVWPNPFASSEKTVKGVAGLIKDESYIYENEFRFLAMHNPNKKLEINPFYINISSLISLDAEIIASPFLADWESESIGQILKKENMYNIFKKSSLPLNNTSL